MILLACDVDGTLDCSGGPVSVAALERLDADEDGPVICIVSPSAAYRGTLHRIDFGSRLENLRAFAASAPGADLRLYVDDSDANRAAAEAAGFCFIDAASFAKGLLP